jgi:excisionase family DNA binding protein
LNPAEVAERLRIALSTVYTLCAAGKLRHSRPGLGRGTIRIDDADLVEYLASVTQGGEVAPVDPKEEPARRKVRRGWREEFADVLRQGTGT